MPALQAQKEDKQEKKQEAINAAHAGQVQAAQKAAEAWLTLVDAEKFDESWKETSPFLQSHVPEKSWEKHMQTMRAAIDPMVDRTLHTTQYRDQFPGLPAGEYVAFVWETYFGAKRTMLESLIMSFDGSQWKPVGYAVQ
jgi:ribosomal protein S20